MPQRGSTPVKAWEYFKGLKNLVNFKLENVLTSKHTCCLLPMSVTISDLEDGDLILWSDLLTSAPTYWFSLLLLACSDVLSVNEQPPSSTCWYSGIGSEAPPVAFSFRKEPAEVGTRHHLPLTKMFAVFASLLSASMSSLACLRNASCFPPFLFQPAGFSGRKEELCRFLIAKGDDKQASWIQGPGELLTVQRELSLRHSAQKFLWSDCSGLSVSSMYCVLCDLEQMLSLSRSPALACVWAFS